LTRRRGRTSLQMTSSGSAWLAKAFSSGHETAWNTTGSFDALYLESTWLEKRYLVEPYHMHLAFSFLF
jgi:hypothetical protein